MLIVDDAVVVRKTVAAVLAAGPGLANSFSVIGVCSHSRQ